MLDRGRLDTEYPGPSPGDQRFYAGEGVGFWIDVKATYRARRGERINIDTSGDAVLHGYLSNLREYYFFRRKEEHPVDPLGLVAEYIHNPEMPYFISPAKPNDSDMDGAYKNIRRRANLGKFIGLKKAHCREFGVLKHVALKALDIPSEIV